MDVLNTDQTLNKTQKKPPILNVIKDEIGKITGTLEIIEGWKQYFEEFTEPV